MTFVSSPAGTIELCWDCTKRFVPGYNLELHHAGYSDHIEDAYQRSIEKERAEHLAAVAQKETTS